MYQENVEVYYEMNQNKRSEFTILQSDEMKFEI